MFKIRQEDHELLQPGMRVRITPSLMGKLFDASDPDELQKWCGCEVTVREVCNRIQWMVSIEEAGHEDLFFMEEIECIIDDIQIEESDEPLSTLLGGAV